MKAYAVKAMYIVARPDVHFFPTSEEAVKYMEDRARNRLESKYLGYIEVKVLGAPIDDTYYRAII